MIIAAGKGHLELLARLIAVGAHINQKGKNDRTALIVASANGHLHCVKELLKAGADVNVLTFNGITALATAIIQGHVECAKQLIEVAADKEFPLFVAANNGMLNIVKILFSAGADVNAEIADKKVTSVIGAAANGHVGCMQELINAGAEVNKQTTDGETALLVAVRKGYINCAELLIKSGTDVNITDTKGTSALEQVISNRHVDLVRKLIAVGVDVNISSKPLLITSVKAGNFESIEELLKLGTDVNITDKDGNTPLMAAVDIGNEAIVQLLLENSAEVNERVMDKGKSALYQTVNHGHITTAQLNPNQNILRMLMAAGGEMEETESFESDRSLQDLARRSIGKHLKLIHQGKNLYITIPRLGLPSRMYSYLLFYTYTPKEGEINLHSNEEEMLCIATQKDVDTVHRLTQAGVDVNIQDKSGMTVLMLASLNGHVELVQELIKAGANMNIQASFGDTAVICATKAKKMNCLQTLIELGANVNVQDRNGQTALWHASTIENQCTEIFEDLIGAGANPNIPDANGLTPFMLTCFRQSSHYLNTMIKSDADVNFSQFSHGRSFTALQMAIQCENLDYVKILIEAGADINEVELYQKKGFTPLIAAVVTGHIGCTKELIRAGADLNIPNMRGKTPLMIAPEISSGLVTTLLQDGAEVNTTFLTFTAMKLLFRLAQNSGGTVTPFEEWQKIHWFIMFKR